MKTALIIGGGPAGLMAALTAARGGADVILADEDSLMGGRLNAESGAGSTQSESLYIEIRDGTTPTDPAPWFAATKES